MTSSPTELLVRSGHSPGPDEGSWRPWFKIHKATCRYAGGADSLGIYLQMWGRADFDLMVEQGRVALCKICKPVLP